MEAVSDRNAENLKVTSLNSNEDQTSSSNDDALACSLKYSDSTNESELHSPRPEKSMEKPVDDGGGGSSDNVGGRNDVSENDRSFKIEIKSEVDYFVDEHKAVSNSTTTCSGGKKIKIETEHHQQIKKDVDSSQIRTKNKRESSSRVTRSEKNADTEGSSIALNSFKPLSNGIPPKSGKPMMAALTKKIKPRAKPKRKPLPFYHSQISDNKIGIKLCIKKSLDIAAAAVATPKAKTPSRKRSRKPKAKPRYTSDSEDSEQGKRRRRESIKKNSNNNTKGYDKESDEPIEQSPWGDRIPENVLHQIFRNVVDDSGCLPAIVRLGQVCSLWYSVSLSPTLWRNLDLQTYTKDKLRTELQLKWLIKHRLKGCHELNLGNWKITNYECVLEKLVEMCPDLKGISVAGWINFSYDHLAYVVENFQVLERIDLSSINVETSTSKTAVGLLPLSSAFQTMGERLTHISLSNNRLAGVQQFMSCLAKHCPNLISLDLSNVKSYKTSLGILPIEQLQSGCPKLKVLLITNSQITLITASMQELMDSLGFPDLEELSVASLADESRLYSDDTLHRILKTSTKLKLLDIRGCARITHDSLIRLPTWDLKHLFLSGCSITRDTGSGLELIASKWAHSLTEIDLAWANVSGPLDSALKAFAEKGSESPLSHINLCGSSVSLDAVKEVLKKCPSISSINLSSCRGLPRGVKRLLQGTIEINELKETLGVIEKQKPAVVKSSAQVCSPTSQDEQSTSQQQSPSSATDTAQTEKTTTGKMDET